MSEWLATQPPWIVYSIFVACGLVGVIVGRATKRGGVRLGLGPVTRQLTRIADKMDHTKGA